MLPFFFPFYLFWQPGIILLLLFLSLQFFPTTRKTPAIPPPHALRVSFSWRDLLMVLAWEQVSNNNSLLSGRASAPQILPFTIPQQPPHSPSQSLTTPLLPRAPWTHTLFGVWQETASCFSNGLFFSLWEGISWVFFDPSCQLFSRNSSVFLAL